MKEVFVSVILPTFQREELLCQTIKDVLALDYPNYEIIIIDQSASHTPETEIYLEEVQDSVRYIKREKPSLILALNAAVSLAKGDILLFIDDDIILPQSDFIQRHLKNYEDAQIAGVAGKVLDANNPQDGEFDPRSQDAVWGFFYTQWNHNCYVDSDMAPGANMSFRRNILVASGGFDEAYVESPARFEQDMCLRVKAQGYRVVFDPSPVVHHFYESPGGCENRNLSDSFSHDDHSHGWYRNFFCSSVYFSLVHMPWKSLPALLWFMYRKYALNMPYLRNGLKFFLVRQEAFVHGLLRGCYLYLIRDKSLRVRHKES